jgi:HK97 family phage prohead protease
VKDIGEDGRTVTGFAAVFGNIDHGADRLHRGAFRKTLQERQGQIKHLWQHDMWQPPIALVKEVSEVGREELPETVQVKWPEASGGLRVVRRYLDTPRGNEILAGVVSGALTEMSFGYDPVKFDFEDVPGDTMHPPLKVRNLREVKLYETSDVLWGMNGATVASKGIEFGLTQLERMADSMMAEVKAGRVLSAANLSRLKEALATLSEILLAAEPPDDDAKVRRVVALTEQIKLRLAIAERVDIYALA